MGHARPDSSTGRTTKGLVAVIAVALCISLGTTLLLAQPSGAVRAAPTADATTTSTTLLPLIAPDRYVPPQGVKFNHWNITSMRNTIRRHVLRSINSTPRGASIRWIVFSFGDWKMYHALVRARKRGVSVQVIGDWHNQETWAPWRKLQATLGTKMSRPGRNPERLSWARQCKHSCRGWGGNVHVKLFLFSQVATATNVTMYGSWNPSWVANERQWNHLDTRYDPATYQRYLAIFHQAKRDRAFGYAHWVSGGMEHMVFPKPGTRASNDPVQLELAKISCISPPDAAGVTRRTVIRIGMYVFGGSRGTYMARRIRSLWNHGCNVAILYGFMSDRAKSILYSPSGRGRIPMKQAMKIENGLPYRYLHHKFVAVSGVYDGHPGSNVVWAGSTNFSNLGFSADDMTVRSMMAANTAAYFKDWDITWRGPNVHAPHSGVSNPEARTTTTQLSQKLRAPLGEGFYSKLSAD